MTKIKITVFAVIAVLLPGLLALGCSSGGNDNPGQTNAREKIFILQAYGNAGEGSPAGVSHSFVELYNISDEAIKLDGIKLYYANGIRGADVTEDEPWKSIDLTGTIPAKGSFLVLGAIHSDLSTTRYIIDDNYGDINNNNLSLSRRSFKVAIISGSAALTVQNPFDTDGNGKVISGYIDMVGAVNNPTDSNPDNIFGYESAPARNSASQAVRRNDLTDTDNNSNDFTSARYGPTSGEDKTLSKEEFDARKPRNSTAGTWDPFAKPADPPAPPDTTAVDYTKLKINEVSGVGTDVEKFYELINTGTKDIPLFDCKIYYSANSNAGGALPAGKGNLTWTGTTSQTAEAGKLFSLIGRNTVGSFTTGLTASRTLVITLEDPEGIVIDKCVRGGDTGDYAITDKSFSRIPDGTGDFYFTTPTPNAANVTSAVGLKKLPKDAPIITDFNRDITSVIPTDTVTVSATVKPTSSSLITSVVIQWTLGGDAQSDINMTATDNVYSATIPVQAVDSVVTYKVTATNAIGETNSSAVGDYKVAVESIDFTKLKLNEVSGVGADSAKFYELINTGTKDISLVGCKIYYNANSNAGGSIPTGKGNLTWTGLSTHTIQAGKLLSIIGRDNPAGTNPGSFTTGLTASRILVIILEDPNGTEIDRCVRAEDTTPYNITDKSFSRIPDGTGDFYFTTPTPNVTNGTSTTGLTKVPATK